MSIKMTSQRKTSRLAKTDSPVECLRSDYQLSFQCEPFKAILKNQHSCIRNV